MKKDEYKMSQQVDTTNYKEKYKEALKVMESLYNVVKYQSNSDALLTRQTIEKAFPNLKESEDEKNIKNLIDELKHSLTAANCQNDATGGGHEKRIALLEWGISWLEKQCKQKPIWSEEDESWFKDIELMALSFSKDDSYRKKFFAWLKSIKSNHWKPTEEQMMTLCALCVLHKESKVLESLYNDLKSL